MNQQQATDISVRQAALKVFLGDRTSYRPEEVAHLNPPTNEELSRLEVFELHRDKPKQFTAYVNSNHSNIVSTWFGDRIGDVCYQGKWHINNFGSKWRQIKIRLDFTYWYYTGREYESRQCVNFKKMKVLF